eukprot:5753374-Amphidinium_carterae.2
MDMMNHCMYHNVKQNVQDKMQQCFAQGWCGLTTGITCGDEAVWFDVHISMSANAAGPQSCP